MENNNDMNNTSAAGEQETKRLNAEAKVEAMFAQARASKRVKESEKRIHSPAIMKDTPQSADKKAEEILEQVRIHKITTKSENPDLSDVVTSDSPQTPEEKVAAMFAQASASNHHGKSKSYNLSATGTEVMILEFISLFIFFMCMNSPMFETFSFLAVMMPPIVGIASRILRHGLTLSEAVSKCKLHIFVAILFFIIIFLTVV